MCLHHQYWDRTISLGNSLTLSGYSRSAYRSGFCIKEWGVFLDAGLSTFTHPNVVLITHGHGDHTFSLGSFSLGGRQPAIICPEATRETLIQLLSCIRAANNEISIERARAIITRQHCFKGLQGDLRPFNIHIKGKQTLKITPIQLTHSISSIGYGISQVSRGLSHQVLHLVSRDKLGSLMRVLKDRELNPGELDLLPEQTDLINQLKRDDQLMVDRFKPVLAYLLDTTSKVFDQEQVFQFPLIVTEATFLMEDDISDARQKKHTHLFDLLPIILEHPDNKFVLTHFSLRYTDDEILSTCRALLGPVDNVCLWLDQGPLWLVDAPFAEAEGGDTRPQSA